MWLCYPLGILGLFGTGFAYVLSAGVGGIAHVLALAFVLFLIGTIVVDHIYAWRKARVYPYFDKYLQNSGTYLSGQAILRNLLHLDRLAESKGIQSISSFGFPDPLRGGTVVWHQPVDGIAALDGLIQAVRETPDVVDDSAAVICDFEKIRDAFERARSEGIRFSFLMEEMGGTSGLVWDRRGGMP